MADISSLGRDMARSPPQCGTTHGMFVCRFRPKNALGEELLFDSSCVPQHASQSGQCDWIWGELKRQRDRSLDMFWHKNHSYPKNRSNNHHMEVSWNKGTPKSSILMWFSLINPPFCGTPTYGNPNIPLLCAGSLAATSCRRLGTAAIALVCRRLRGAWWVAGSPPGARTTVWG